LVGGGGKKEKTALTKRAGRRERTEGKPTLQYSLIPLPHCTVQMRQTVPRRWVTYFGTRPENRNGRKKKKEDYVWMIKLKRVLSSAEP